MRMHLYYFYIIIETFERVKNGEARFGLLPWENSIQGQVKDTYEALQDDDGFGKRVFVGGEYTFGIDHCLLVKKGVAVEEIKRVMSHEQVRSKFFTRGES